MKISLQALRQSAYDLGFDLKITDAGSYQLIQRGGYGTETDGSFDDVRQWLLGFGYAKQKYERAY
jgi:hypothetical protein